LSGLKAIDDSQIIIIRGAGVDLSQYEYKPEPSNRVKVVMASRLLKDKGVFEYIEGAKILIDKGIEVDFELYGDIDIYNPATLTRKNLQKITQEGYVKLKGHTDKIAEVFAATNIVVLPSYREGLPKVLVEASSCGRAIVTTDVPGCRDAIEPNLTGLLCEVKNVYSLAEKIEKLILDERLRKSMGKEGRILAEREFDINKIVVKHLEV